MIAETVAIPIIPHTTNTGTVATAALTAKSNRPHRTNLRRRIWGVFNPRASTNETINGASRYPTLPPVAINPFAVSLALNQRTAINSRNVPVALSTIPALMARQLS